MKKSLLSSEENEQIMLFQWADIAAVSYPELRLMFHVPNEGKRSAATGSRFKQMGLRSGVPDVILPVARGKFIGLAIEMKYGKNSLTANQKKWLGMLADAGHKTAVCYSFGEAKKTILDYLNADPAEDGI